MRIYGHTQEHDPRFHAFMAGHTLDDIRMVSSLDKRGPENHFVLRQDLADGPDAIQARLASVNPGTRAGQMIRESMLDRLSREVPANRSGASVERDDNLDADHEMSGQGLPEFRPGIPDEDHDLEAGDPELDEDLEDDLDEDLTLEEAPGGPERVAEIAVAEGGWDLHAGDKWRAQMAATSETFNVASLVRVRNETVTLAPKPATPSRERPSASGETERKGREKPSAAQREHRESRQEATPHDFGGIRIALPGAGVAAVTLGAAGPSPSDIDRDNTAEKVRKQREHADAVRHNLASRFRQIERFQQRMDRLDRRHERIMNMLTEQAEPAAPRM